MKKFYIKIAFFLLPFILAMVIEIFILPIDFFTFRAWEALRVEGKSLTPGKFYPQMKLHKEEVGRSAHHTPYAVKKQVTWITDEFGFRKADSQQKISVVLIGDSFIAGDGLDQQEILSEQLQSRLDLGVYPVATANFNDFLNMPRFCQTPPDVVVLQKLEKTVERLKTAKINSFKQKSWQLRQMLCENSVIRFIDITQNRAAKGIMLNYFKSRVRDWMGLRKFDSNNIRQFADKNIFLDPEEFALTPTEEEIQSIVSRLVEYKKLLEKRRIRFIFMPMPNKTTVYYKIAGRSQCPAFIDKLIAAARKAGIETIDLKDAFAKSLQKNAGTLLYIADDSHWNENGVKVAADLLAAEIKNKSWVKTNPADKSKTIN